MTRLGKLNEMLTKALLLDCFDDDDTYRVLDIALTFLSQYFGHHGNDAKNLMKRFFSDFSDRFDEETIHHESSYRMAAIIHYLSYKKGNPNELGDWLISTGHHQAPPEALEYYRERYFTNDVGVDGQPQD